MARGLLALAALAVLLPAVTAQTGLGLGGLAPSTAPGPAAATANIDVPTDLCDAEFCLQAAPAACGGNCILTPLGNTTRVSRNLSFMAKIPARCRPYICGCISSTPAASQQRREDVAHGALR